MSKLSTHVLDTQHGKPAAGLSIVLLQKQGDTFVPIKAVKTNVDGRCDAPLLEKEHMQSGAYQLEFDVESYFATIGIACPFLKDVVIRFYLNADENYHVPLLITPFTYSTYRGS